MVCILVCLLFVCCLFDICLLLVILGLRFVATLILLTAWIFAWIWIVCYRDVSFGFTEFEILTCSCFVFAGDLSGLLLVLRLFYFSYLLHRC